MNPVRQLRQKNSLRRVVHACLLLGWLLSSQGVAPALCLAAALYDGEHGVKVGAASDGGTTVVLSHPSAEAGDEHHDLLCHLLLIFASPPQAGGTDHVLAFKSVDAISRAQRGALVDHQVTIAGGLLPECRLRPLAHRASASPIKNSRAPAWSPALALKAGKTIMLC